MQLTNVAVAVLAAFGLAAAYPDDPATPAGKKDPKAFDREVTVLAVMETDPVQLTVSAKAGGKTEKFAVLLADDTKFAKDGKAVDRLVFKPDQTVRLVGKLTGEGRLTATRVEVGKPKEKDKPKS